MTAPAKMTVVELREALKARGLDAGGLKPALVSRLQQALEADEAAEAGGPAAAAAAAAADEATLKNESKAAGESRATRERRRVARHPFDPSCTPYAAHPRPSVSRGDVDPPPSLSPRLGRGGLKKSGLSRPTFVRSLPSQRPGWCVVLGALFAVSAPDARRAPPPNAASPSVPLAADVAV